jgi:hypothetical protein
MTVISFGYLSDLRTKNQCKIYSKTVNSNKGKKYERRNCLTFFKKSNNKNESKTFLKLKKSNKKTENNISVFLKFFSN